jgi:hypothetical protein
MRLTDWRGNEYGVGDKVIYGRMSGRSVEMQEAVVAEIYRAYQDNETYKWKRLAEDDEIPFMRIYQQLGPDPRGDWGYLPTGDPVEITVRVRVQPTGKGSRSFYRDDYTASWPDGYEGKMIVTPHDPKPVTLIIIENITKLMD